MKKLIGSLTVVAAVVIASVAPISAQSVTTDSRAVTDQVQIDFGTQIGTRLDSLSPDILNKLEDAKKSIEFARSQLINLNQAAADSIKSLALLNADKAFFVALQAMDNVSEEIRVQIEKAKGEIQSQMQIRMQEIKNDNRK